MARQDGAGQGKASGGPAVAVGGAEIDHILGGAGPPSLPPPGCPPGTNTLLGHHRSAECSRRLPRNVR
jgi:hypothetical protein